MTTFKKPIKPTKLSLYWTFAIRKYKNLYSCQKYYLYEMVQDKFQKILPRPKLFVNRSEHRIYSRICDIFYEL